MQIIDILGKERYMPAKQVQAVIGYTQPTIYKDLVALVKMGLVEMKGRGRLVAFSIIAVGTPMMIEEGFGREHPYCSGIVELEEGVKIAARIVGVDVSRPEELKIGTPVTIEYQEREYRGKKRTFLAFKA